MTGSHTTQAAGDTSAGDTSVWDAAARHVAEELASTSQWLYQHGWSPATSSNYSCRVDENRIALTTSGKDKGRLTADDIMLIDRHGVPQTAGKPSAETGLHTQLYQHFPGVGAVLHTHSTYATVLSRRLGVHGTAVINGYELAKAFEGIGDHRTPVHVPVFANDQDIPRLARDVQQWLQGADGQAQAQAQVAYLIEGHGTYTWAADLPTCRRHIEALEFLFQCLWLESAATSTSPLNERGFSV
jgi:methylthioribulose-1-phosphate dehydratase